MYVTVYTSSTAFPTTVGSFATTLNGTADIFITKMNPTGTGLVYSTYIGGNNDDISWGISVDSIGNAYIAGRTLSSNFPLTAGALDSTNTGVFLSKLNASGSNLLYSTFIGSGYGYGLALDSSGGIYLTGSTGSSSFPTTLGALDTTYNSGSYDAFVTKLDAIPILNIDQWQFYGINTQVK